jgi:hypothetical protein
MHERGPAYSNWKSRVRPRHLVPVSIDHLAGILCDNENEGLNMIAKALDAEMEEATFPGIASGTVVAFVVPGDRESVWTTALKELNLPKGATLTTNIDGLMHLQNNDTCSGTMPVDANNSESCAEHMAPINALCVHLETPLPGFNPCLTFGRRSPPSASSQTSPAAQLARPCTPCWPSTAGAS